MRLPGDSFETNVAKSRDCCKKNFIFCSLLFRLRSLFRLRDGFYCRQAGPDARLFSRGGHMQPTDSYPLRSRLSVSSASFWLLPPGKVRADLFLLSLVRVFGFVLAASARQNGVSLLLPSLIRIFDFVLDTSVRQNEVNLFLLSLLRIFAPWEACGGRGPRFCRGGDSGSSVRRRRPQHVEYFNIRELWLRLILWTT